MEELFKVAGDEFYFDLDRISDFIKLDKQEDELEKIFTTKETTENTVSNEETEIMNEEEALGQMIDLTKWELTKAMIETVLSEQGIIDETMGLAKLESQLSIPFRISFNTLLINKILKKNG